MLGSYFLALLHFLSSGFFLFIFLAPLVHTPMDSKWRGERVASGVVVSDRGASLKRLKRTHPPQFSLIVDSF